jgi:hypothetical protein
MNHACMGFFLLLALATLARVVVLIRRGAGLSNQAGRLPSNHRRASIDRSIDTRTRLSFFGSIDPSIDLLWERESSAASLGHVISRSNNKQEAEAGGGTAKPPTQRLASLLLSPSPSSHFFSRESNRLRRT